MLWREFLVELQENWNKLPNIITGIRLLFCFLPGLLLTIDSSSLIMRIGSMAILLIVAGTDAVDGYYARSRNEITELGKILDPLVDKVLAGVTLIFLSFYSMDALLLLIFSIIRATSIGFRLVNYKRRRLPVDVVYSGKINTVILTISMAMLFIPLGGVWKGLTNVFLLATYAASVYSWIEYLRQYPKISRK